ncbi:spermidine/putrescine ABC transporter substrate-binding protein [Sporanaerobium hydrogeniformans]|uniref:Spermidine/putrescine ABC transporter substrate-binding protein n=1 Tax=Sporanaerobium hydrogeniformans TaxID=3072179 RepID=A0AC61DFA2_9FIRM|nr:ABC transporter substrate-binding protein [Sporanaerobium hydrogeniformans]PHV71555.1 spermidine/putrescine ABC transporter substrate-binding protein [Sporanaerobium hydrogeniformans]
MKKLIKVGLPLALAGVLVLSLVGCGGANESSSSGNEKVVVYNWGDYIDPDVNAEFTKETGIKVVYSEYANNEEMYATVEPGNVNYDILIPSDYMIEKMINNDMLAPMDTSKIPNYTKIDERFKGLPFDKEDKYSVPYMWGTVGIVYNKTMVDEPVDSWDILWDEKYDDKIFMYDSERDSIMVALKKLGYSMNTRDPKELEEAKNLLIKQAPLVLAYVGDEGKGKMVNGEAALMIAWAGDAMVMMDQNPDLDFAIPKEGSNYFVDSIVIHKDAKNKEAAYKYIDFLCRPDIAARNAEYIGYSTPISEARELLPEEIKNSPVAYPDEAITSADNMEMFNDPSDVIELYSDLWTQVKASNQ